MSWLIASCATLFAAEAAAAEGAPPVAADPAPAAPTTEATPAASPSDTSSGDAISEDEATGASSASEAAPPANPAAPAASPAVQPAPPPAPAPVAKASSTHTPGADQAPANESAYTHGRLGSVRVGPVISAGIPDGMRFELTARYKGLLGAGLAGSMLPTLKIPALTAQVERSGLEFYGRLHPFRGAFYMGAGIGYAKTNASVGGQATASADTAVGTVSQTVSASATGSTNVTYIAPQIGFLWSFKMGLSIGFDAALQMPIAASSSVNTAISNGIAVEDGTTQQVRDAVDVFTRTPIPVIHPLQLGFLL